MARTIQTRYNNSVVTMNLIGRCLPTAVTVGGYEWPQYPELLLPEPVAVSELHRESGGQPGPRGIPDDHDDEGRAYGCRIC